MNPLARSDQAKKKSRNISIKSALGYKSFTRARQRYGIGAPQLRKHQQKLADEMLLFRFAPRQIENLSRIMRDTIEVTRILERAVAKICIQQAKVSRKHLLKKFTGRESDLFLDSQPYARQRRKQRDAAVTFRRTPRSAREV